jgi:hypothetical protein
LTDDEEWPQKGTRGTKSALSERYQNPRDDRDMAAEQRKESGAGVIVCFALFYPFAPFCG